jgi:hypothetical protein
LPHPVISAVPISTFALMTVAAARSHKLEICLRGALIYAIAHYFRTAAGFDLRRQSRGVLGFELFGTFVAEHLVETHGIVKRFDVLEHAQRRGFEVGERLMLGPLLLERPEESLGDRVVVAFARATDRTCVPRAFKVL